MKMYKTKPGVVLTEIAGEYVLVSAKKLQPECPYVTQISESSAFLWRHLTGGATLDELEKAVCDEYLIDDIAETRQTIIDFLQQITDLHYLLLEENIDE